MKRKKVIVTGATGGIGSVLCRKLASEGYDLILVARDLPKLEKICSELKSQFGGSHESLPIDFADISTLIAQKSALQNLGEISGLVIMPPQAPQSNNCFPSIEEWNDLFSRCFTNPVELIKAIIPQMGKAARGKVVIVSGISSAQVLSHYATSNVLRCAWLAQAKTMAFALGERNIHVNTVSLGGTLTEKYKAGIQTRGLDFGRTFEEQLVEETNNVPLRKYATPEEVSEVIAQMLGAFSDHISGVNLLCDGGFTRAY